MTVNDNILRPVTDAIIETSWGVDVADTLNWVYDNKVNLAGATMTGALYINPAGAGNRCLRMIGASPFLDFVSEDSSMQYGYIQGAAGSIVYFTEGTGYSEGSGVSPHVFYVGGTERFRVDSSGVTVAGRLDATVQSDFNGGARFGGGSGGQVALIDTSTAAGADYNDVYLSFYGQGASMASPGSRTGYVGFPGNTTLSMINELANGPVHIKATGTGTLTLGTGTSGDVSVATGSGGNILLNAGGTGVTVFYTGGSERGRVTGADFLWGKSTGNVSSSVGCELTEAGRIMSTTSNNAYTNLYLRHNTDLDGAAFIQFANSGGGILSHITQDTTTPVGVHFPNVNATAPSDYRLKDELGPVVGALDRVMQLAPKRLRWKDGGDPFDGFLAHEVAEVVPRAVRGEKDATYNAAEAELMGAQEGDIKPQQFNEAALIPLLVAAIQELATQGKPKEV